jgi:hypothetical protein
MHLWDWPSDRGRVALRGSVAARVICMDRRGTVLSDVELLVPPTGSDVMIAAGTEMMAVACFGRLPSDAKPAPAAGGAVTTRYAPSGAVAAVGWQSTSTVAQVGPSCFAARGATLRVLRPASIARNAQRASVGTTQAADVLRGQIGIETRLPIGITVVIVALDAADPMAASRGDLALSAVGARLGTPMRVLLGARRLVVYDVLSTDANADCLTIAIASTSAWNVSAVIGVQGTSADWTATVASGVPDGFVPDGPLAPDGALTVSYIPGAPA